MSLNLGFPLCRPFKLFVKCNKLKTERISSEVFVVVDRTLFYLCYFSLNVDHDNSTRCGSGDKYIMAPIDTVFGQYDIFSSNPWKFSDCSIEEMQAFVTTTG